MSGVLVGQRIDAQPGTPTSRPTPSSRSGTRTRRSRTATPAATSTRRRSSAGRDPGHGRGPRGSVFGLPHARGVPIRAPGPVRPVRGDRGGDRHATTSGETSDCATLGPDCILIVVSPLEGLARQEGRPACRRRDPQGRRLRARRPDRRRRPRPRPRQEGHDGHPHDPARDRRAVRRPDRSRCHRPARGHRARPGRRDDRLHQRDRLLRQRCRPVPRGPQDRPRRRTGRRSSSTSAAIPAGT